MTMFKCRRRWSHRVRSLKALLVCSTMTTFLTFPNEIILEIGENLPSKDVFSLYSVCRRLRGITARLLRRHVSVVPTKLPSMMQTMIESSYFGQSLCDLSLNWTGNPDVLPESSVMEIRGAFRDKGYSFPTVILTQKIGNRT